MANEPQVSLNFPADLAAELERKAKAMGMSVAGYVRLLAGHAEGTLDAQAMDAVRFAFTKHAESLRKLAQ